MKKIIVLLLTLLLIACSPEKKDYYKLSFNDYSVSVGYDSSEYLSVIFDYDLKHNEELKLSLFKKYFGKCIINDDDIVTYLQVYLDDYPGVYKIDDIELDKSVSKNCEIFEGEMINKNGNACIIQKTVGDYTNAIILYDDLLNGSIDELKKIEIYLK